MKASMRWIVVMCLILLGRSSIATFIDFEDLPDSILVEGFYAAEGLYFGNAIALKAGFSLNEIDYPPRSYDTVIGDNDAEIAMIFDNVVNDISAYFTYGDGLIFKAYDVLDQQIDSPFILTGSNLGSSNLITLPFRNVRRLSIAGNTPNMFVMDDLSFSPVLSVADVGGTFSILGGACMALMIISRKR